MFTLSFNAQGKRFLYLAIALFPIVASFLLNRGVPVPTWACPLMKLIGIPCPAWGLTRSFLAIARGDLHRAIAYHWFGPVVFFGFLVAAIHLLFEIVRNQKINAFYITVLRRPSVQISLYLVVLGYHMTRLMDLADSGELYTSFIQSPVAQFLL